ncbi:beta strand repeat-containing protein, partial [Mycolicibacterium obuense]
MVITDIDSTQLASATVTASGGTIGYGTLPSGVTATPGAGSVTFTGAASVAAYQQLLQSITLTSGGAAIVTVTFAVVDDQGEASVPASSVVTVLGVPVAVPPLVVVSPVAAGTAGSAVTVSPIVSITDVDSTQLGSATVAASGGTIGYGTLPSGVTATPGAGSVTFTGAASVAAYQQLLQSITLTSGGAAIVTVTFTVVDDQGEASVPASSVVTVLGVPVAVPPLVVVSPVAAGTAGSAVTVSPIVSITDVDSTQLGSATVAASGGTIGYGTLPSGVTATPSTNSVTFTGAASVAAYQELLQSITLTSGTGMVAVTFTVVDDQGKASVPASSVVTVLGVPVAVAPIVVTAPLASATAGSAVVVSPVVVITDVDSTQLASATVTATGGTIGYGTLPSGVTATPGANSVTFTGAASVAAYQTLLQSITLTSGTGIVAVTFTVVDDQGKASVPATSVVTVLGVPVAAPPLVVVSPVAAGTAGSAVTVSPIVSITDVDSTQLGSATVTATGGTIGYGTLPSGVTATPGANSVTFTGAASVAAYQTLLQSITVTSGTGIVTVTFTVVDDQGKASVPASSVVTVLGLPVAVPPLVVVSPVAAGTAGSAVTVSPIVSITDVDSTQLGSAT